LVIFIRDSNSEIVGGLVGETHWGWLFISHLWVAQSLRGQGYGREIMLKAEQEVYWIQIRETPSKFKALCCN
jgi:GNAT superfamily N-acetyltransferase